MSKLILGPIVGGLSHDSAHLWARASGEGILHAWYGEKSNLSDAQRVDLAQKLTEETGFAGFVPLNNLSHKTEYHYTVSLDDKLPDTAKEYPSFTTFPLENEAQSFSFAFGSCFRPEGEHPGRIFDKLEYVRSLWAKDSHNALRFIMLLGDQIYADDCKHNNLGKVCRSVEEYRKVYAHTWSRPPLRALLKNLPAFMILDDHEVDDDWSWTDSNRKYARISRWDRFKRLIQRRSKAERKIEKKNVQEALQAYWEHQGMHARGYKNILAYDPITKKYPLSPDDETSFAYSFNYGAAAFFVLDTRTRRIKRKFHKNTLLGEDQWKRLMDWLDNVKDTHPVKFIVTSSALLFRMYADFPQDRWTGFRGERKKLLEYLADNNIEGVYLLAGDLHSAHAVSAELRGSDGHKFPLWEFCSSPFEQTTNWLAKGTYFPLMHRSIQNQQLHFVCAEHNFGVVRVQFSKQDKPKVSFEVHRLGGAPPVILDTSI